MPYERDGWPNMYLTPAQWRWFDEQDAETQRNYYEWATASPKVEA